MANIHQTEKSKIKSNNEGIKYLFGEKCKEKKNSGNLISDHVPIYVNINEDTKIVFSNNVSLIGSRGINDNANKFGDDVDSKLTKQITIGILKKITPIMIDYLINTVNNDPTKQQDSIKKQQKLNFLRTYLIGKNEITEANFTETIVLSDLWTDKKKTTSRREIIKKITENPKGTEYEFNLDPTIIPKTIDEIKKKIEEIFKLNGGFLKYGEFPKVFYENGKYKQEVVDKIISKTEKNFKYVRLFFENLQHRNVSGFEIENEELGDSTKKKY